MEKSTIRRWLRAWFLTAKLLTLIALYSCDSSSEEKSSIPKNIIPRDSMVAVLTDVHIVEGAKVGNKIMGDTAKVSDYYDKLYKKHNITQKQFEESFDYYTENPGIMQDIYKQVVENLNKIDLNPKRERLEDEEAETGKDEEKTEPESTEKERGTKQRRDATGGKASFPGRKKMRSSSTLGLLYKSRKNPLWSHPPA